ncbi:MAG: glycosyltransferase [bacterium]|nr:glycosyltransferase [bacterium]
MKSLFLLFHGRFPSEKAASLFTAKGAEAFADSGMRVIVVVPRRKKVESKNPFDFYDVKVNFTVKYIPTIDLFGILPDKIAFWASFIVFSIFGFFFVKKASKNDDIIYSNESLPLFLISFIRQNCFFEMHDFPESKLRFFTKFLSRMHWILVHNRWKLTEVGKKFPNILRKKFIYEPNAVDLKTFDIDISKIEARKRLGLPTDRKIAVYTGHLYGWKGVDTLALSAQFLEDEYLIIFVGGTDKDVEIFRKKYGSSGKILIAGYKPHREIPLWQKSADILVLPNTAKEAISAYYTSPMKLFEYMASRRPIVASDISSIREIVDERSAILVVPDEPQILAKAINNLVKIPKIGDEIAEQAFKDVSNHTWSARAGRILNFIEKV